MVEASFPKPVIDALESYEQNFGMNYSLASDSGATVGYLSTQKNPQVLLAGFLALTNEETMLVTDEKDADGLEAIRRLADAAAQTLHNKGVQGVAQLKKAIMAHVKKTGGVITPKDAMAIRQRVLTPKGAKIFLDRWDPTTAVGRRQVGRRQVGDRNPFVGTNSLGVDKLDAANRAAQTQTGSARTAAFKTQKEQLRHIEGVLRTGQADKAEIAALMKVMPATLEVAKEEDSVGFWGSILAILTLGLSLLWDYANDDEHEQVLDMLKRVKARVELAKIDPGRKIERKLNSERISARKNPKIDVIPGTKEPWTAVGVARLLKEWMDGPGTSNEKRILDILYGLNIKDREAIAVAWSKLEGTNLQGRAAYNALRTRVVGELNDNAGDLKIINTRDGYIANIILDPNNLSGDTSLAQEFLFDLGVVGDRINRSGISTNPKPVIAKLSKLSTVELKVLDNLVIESDPEHRTLIQVLKDELNDIGENEEQRALFAVTAPRTSSLGGLTAQDWRVYEVMATVEGMGTREISLNNAVMGMTFDQIKAMAPVYYATRHLWGDENQEGTVGTPASEGNFKDTAFYKRLHSEVANDDAGTVTRFEMAMGGLGGPSKGESIEAFQKRVADYVAVTFATGSPSEIRTALKFLKTPDENDPRRVTMTQVSTSFGEYPFGGNVFTTLRERTTGQLNTLVQMVTKNDVRLNSPEVAAAYLADDMEKGFGFAGASMDVVMKQLNHPELSADDRQKFLATVRTVFKRITGNDFDKKLLSLYPDNITLPDGRVLGTNLVKSLLKTGQVPASLRLAAAFADGAKPAQLMAILSELSDPAARMFTMWSYAKLTGRPMQMNATTGRAAGNPLLADFARFAKDSPLAPSMLAVKESDVYSVGLLLETGVNGVTGIMQKILQQRVGGSFTDFMNRYLGDDAAQFLSYVRENGAQATALSMMTTNSELVAMVRGSATSVTDNLLSSFIMDAFDTRGAAIENQLRKLTKAARDAEMSRDGNGRMRPQYAKALGEAYMGLATRIQDYAAVSGARVETLASVVTTVALVGSLVINPGVSTNALVAIGAGTKWGVKGLAGDWDWMSLVEGGAQGFAAGVAAADWAKLPPDVSVAYESFYAAFVSAKRGMIERAVTATLNPDTYGDGVLRGIENISTKSTSRIASDALSGFIGGFLYRKFKDLRAKGKGNPEPKEPTDDREIITDDSAHPGGDATGETPRTQTPGTDGPGGEYTGPEIPGHGPGGAHPGSDGTNVIGGDVVESPIEMSTTPVADDLDSLLQNNTIESNLGSGSNGIDAARDRFRESFRNADRPVNLGTPPPDLPPPTDSFEPINFTDGPPLTAEQTYNELGQLDPQGYPGAAGKALSDSWDLMLPALQAQTTLYMSATPTTMRTHMEDVLANAREIGVSGLPVTLPADDQQSMRLMDSISTQLQLMVNERNPNLDNLKFFDGV